MSESKTRMYVVGGALAVLLASSSFYLQGTTTTDRAISRPCPEPVYPDHRGDPRNRAGHIRQCWPGEARCFCDRDNDCYSYSGYKKCTPVRANADAGVRDTGVVDTGPDVRDVPDVPDVQDVADVRDVVDVPDILDTPDVPDVMDVVDAQDVVDVPDVRDVIDVVDVVDIPITATLKAFPEAEGWGANATGGRGGSVIYVTNLNASGAGSLQNAVEQSGARYILFRVSGVINSDVQIRNGNVTIAGQTSPNGIIVRGLHTTEEPFCDQACGSSASGIQNFIIRHLRSRPSNGDFPDGLRLRYSRNGIVDHCSMGNAEDEAVEISYTNTVTIQDSIFAETLGDHAEYGGMLINYTNPAAGYALNQLSILRNVWNRIQGRYPEFSRESGSAAASTTMQVELTNNLFWDRRYFTDVNPTNISGGSEGSPIWYQMNMIGNYSFARSSNHFGLIWLQNIGGGTTAYFSNNLMNLWPARSDWDMNYCCSDYNGQANARPAWGLTTRHGFPTVTIISASSVRGYTFAHAGAYPRDTMDTRLMGYVNTNTLDNTAINVNSRGDALSIASSSSSVVDTDSDGMPDIWETAHGLNPSVQDHNGTNLSVSMTGAVGYTNIECYLNELANLRVAGTQ